MSKIIDNGIVRDMTPEEQSRYDIDISSTIASLSSFKQSSKNLFNPSTITTGKFIDVDGKSYTSASYNHTDYIPVLANTTYSVSNYRIIAVYNSSKVAISAQGKSASPTSPGTITPLQNGYIIVSYTATAQYVQIERGSTFSTYCPYGIEDISVVGNKAFDLTVVKSGSAYDINGLLPNGNQILLRTLINGSSNGSFSFNRTYINGSISEVHMTTDDVTPIRTFTTVGANHGYPTANITLVGHGKTSSDLGSIWTDGSRQYTLMGISGNVLTFCMEYTVTDGITSCSAVLPSSTLAHVSGGTNTSSISVASKASGMLLPSINNISVKYILDGTDITLFSDGAYFGNKLEVIESYNVLDYKALIDWAHSNIGSSYVGNNSIAGTVALKNTFSFTNGCSCTTYHTLKAITKLSVAACGFIQSGVLSGTTVKRFMNGVSSKNGYDFAAIADISGTYAPGDMVYTTSNLTDGNTPPNRYSDWAYNGSSKLYGFAMGYLPDKTNGKNSTRIANSATNLWDMRTGTKKSYPCALNNLTLNAGDYFSFMGYRVYMSPTTATIATIVRDQKDVYVILDYHAAASNETMSIDNALGKSVTILESANFTLLNDVVNADGIMFNITGAYGYAILKVN